MECQNFTPFWPTADPKLNEEARLITSYRGPSSFEGLSNKTNRDVLLLVKTSSHSEVVVQPGRPHSLQAYHN